MLITNYAIKFRIAVFVLIVGLIAVGTVNYRNLPREGMPDITIPHVYITAIYEGTAPGEIEKLIAIPLEKQLNDVEGVKHIKSTSAENVCSVDIEFIAGEDIDLAKQKVKDKVDLAGPDLPDDLDEPVVQAFNVSSDVPIFRFALSGDTDLLRLKHLAERLKEEIEMVRGVRQATVAGAREREIRVELDADRLAAYGIPVTMVMRRISGENSTISAGNIELEGNKFQVRVPGEYDLVPEISKILLTRVNNTPVYLRDVATVTDTFKDRETISRLNGEPAVSVLVNKRSGENSVAVIERVKKTIEADPLPPGVHLTIVYDESEDVAMMIRELENNIVSGFILVIAVLFIFMGWRNSLFVALAIPMSMLTAFTVMGLMGSALNMIVLFSLVLAVGMLVDNAIVIVENIFRNRSRGLSRTEAARRGASEVAWPVITSTLTTCLAFSPLLFWPDIMGQFMGFLPRTLIIVLFASLFVAIVLNPAVCSALISGAKSKRLQPSDVPDGHWFVNGYENLLRFALRYRWAVIMLALAGFFMTIQLYSLGGKGVELFPEVDPRNAYIQVKFPQGTSIEKTDLALAGIESNLFNYSDIKFFQTTVGEAGGGIFLGGGSGTHVGSIYTEFLDMADRSGSSMELISDLRDEVGLIPGADVKVEREEEGPPTGAPVSIEISGENFDELARLSKLAISKIETIPGIVDLQDDMEEALPELQFRVDRHRAAMMGLDTDSIGLFLRTAIYGIESSKFRADEDEYDITLRFPRDRRNTAHLLDQAYIPVAEGRSVPLSSVGEMVYVGGRGSINRTDRKRVVLITGSNQDRGVDEIMEEVQARLSNLELSPGYEIKYTGDTEEMNKSRQFLSHAFAVAILLIFIVLVIQFNSVVLPLVIILSVVLSIIGVMWGLVICRMKFGIIMTGVGVISLAGIVVNNAIVLVDCILQRRAEGLDRVAAIIKAGRMRLRPVLLTAITTILGLIPMAVGWSINVHRWPPQLVAGAESSAWWAPMAVAVMFGLSVSTALTLLVVPVMYSLADTFTEWFSSKFMRDD